MVSTEYVGKVLSSPCDHQVMKIRQMLTEVLLEVTNQEIEDVATETIEEAKSKLYLCRIVSEVQAFCIISITWVLFINLCTNNINSKVLTL